MVPAIIYHCNAAPVVKLRPLAFILAGVLSSKMLFYLFQLKFIN